MLNVGVLPLLASGSAILFADWIRKDFVPSESLGYFRPSAFADSSHLTTIFVFFCS